MTFDEYVIFQFAVIGFIVVGIGLGSIVSVVVSKIYNSIPAVKRKKAAAEAERERVAREPYTKRWEADGYRDAKRNAEMNALYPDKDIWKRFDPGTDWIADAYNKGYDRYLDEQKENK